MNIQKRTEREFKKWFNALPRYKASGGPARGSLTAAMVVLERLRAQCTLDLDAHRAKGGAQIQGLGKSSVSKILKRLGETRPFLAECGRTNRGVPKAVGDMLVALRTAKFEQAKERERNTIIDSLQRQLLDQIIAYHNQQRLSLAFDPTKTNRQTIADILALARESGKDGPVAQYLVGAKLTLRFPNVEIGNESYSTADVQRNRPGDFLVGDTAFHVTISPQLGHYEKCQKNLADGYKVYLLVPDKSVIGARQTVEDLAAGRISVESIESFVAQNIDELATFSRTEARKQLRHLLNTYNQRVDATETDKSMLIDLPGNLK
jgi:hypothetical protein